MPFRTLCARVRASAFTAYSLVLFAILAMIALTVNLFQPTLRARRRVAGALARVFFRLAGIPLRIEGVERLPQTPCVVVANHASYIDGIVAAAALPPAFAFVIKKEMVRVPLASLLLRGLG
ncbi:MAG TPA: 1-acyl-sn-glycerol-3-phosphate acyltransferase, partial [Candidatus Binataceae bacterium]|nr:1-acyl-sn-glycerol-3-phosphate acyltransferase [Candidatus Binataceae bacterium]